MLMATNSPGILIVDDNEDNRYTLQLMLETDGYERIASAAGGNEAIALIEKEKFSLVLLDLMMPDLNGDEVLKVIKSDPDKRDISVVMISADTTRRRRLSAEAVQSNDPARADRRGAAPALSTGARKRVPGQDRERETPLREPPAQHSPG
jgi:CheY-like chemotaxis protein